MSPRLFTMTLVAGLALASTPMAATADAITATVSNRSSVSPAQNVNFSSNVQIRADAIRLNGRLHAVNLNSRPREALVILKDWFVTTPELVIQPFKASQNFQRVFVPLPTVPGGPPLNGVFVNRADVVDHITPIPHQLVQNDLLVRFAESIDSAGTDATWQNLSIEFIERPPFTDVGLIQQGRCALPVIDLASGAARFFEFRIAPSTTGQPIRLDIDTEGSASDVSLVLYDNAGRMITSDLDDGLDANAQLTFGGPRGPVLTINDARPYDGRDGNLTEGVYVLAVTAGRSGFRSGWTVPGGTAPASGVRINFNSSTGAVPFCIADVDRNGALNAADMARFSDDFLAAP